MFDTTYAVIDCEATGLDLQHDRPVEVAVVLLYPDGHYDRAYETLINPKMPIPPVASAIHHLVDADVSEAPTFDRVRPRLLELGQACAAHNAPQDRSLLELANDGKPWICTWRLAMHLWPDAPAHGCQVLRYWLDLEVPEAKGLPAHRAMADALVTASLLRRALDEIHARGLEIHTPEALARWIARPAELVHIPFGRHRGKRWADMDVGFLEWVLARDFSADVQHTAALWLRRHIDTSPLDATYSTEDPETPF